MTDNAARDELAYGTICGDDEPTDGDQFGADVSIDKMVGKKRGQIHIIVPPVPMKRHKRVIGGGFTKVVDTAGLRREEPKKIEIAPISVTKPNMKIDPKIVAKPPLPPKPVTSKRSVGTSAPKLKQKVEENNAATTVQKLSAQTEQLRLEIAELKSALAAEKSAVRGLR